MDAGGGRVVVSKKGDFHFEGFRTGNEWIEGRESPLGL